MQADQRLAWLHDTQSVYTVIVSLFIRWGEMLLGNSGIFFSMKFTFLQLQMYASNISLKHALEFDLLTLIGCIWSTGTCKYVTNGCCRRLPHTEIMAVVILHPTPPDIYSNCLLLLFAQVYVMTSIFRYVMMRKEDGSIRGTIKMIESLKLRSMDHDKRGDGCWGVACLIH